MKLFRGLVRGAALVWLIVLVVVAVAVTWAIVSHV